MPKLELIVAIIIGVTSLTIILLYLILCARYWY